MANECEICGEDDHQAEEHELVAMGDWSVRGLHLTDSMVDFALAEAKHLAFHTAGPEGIRAMERIQEIAEEREDENPDDEDRIQWESERLDEIESILSDLGYIATSDSDSGTWTIHRPVEREMPFDLDEMVNAYIGCALWAGLDISQADESGNNPPLDRSYGIDDGQRRGDGDDPRRVRGVREVQRS